jgi:transposase
MSTSGGNEMINGTLWHEIHSRFKLKETKKSIARSLGLDVRTVRKILRQREPAPYRREGPEVTLLTPYEDHIRQRLPAVGWCAQSIFEELRPMGYSGGYATVRRFVQPLRQEAHREATVRFETEPGRQGQVDWGKCWTTIAARSVHVRLFVMTLGYSRRLFARATLDEKLPTFIGCHEAAFEHFGGIAHENLYDNPKTVVLSRNFEGSRIEWNPIFWDFSTYRGFKPRLCRPYRAQTKGKVESGVKYVKRFLRGKAFDSLDHLNECLMNWIMTVADERIHGTTHRKPSEMFLKEKGLLLDHRNRPPYVLQDRALRHVAKDCLVSFQTNRYSVPFRFVGQPVEVMREGEHVMLYHRGELIATHPRCEGRNRCITDRAHYQGIYRREPLEIAAWRHPHPGFDMEVQVRDLGVYERLVEGGAR